MKSFKTPVFFRWIFFRRIWGFSSENEVFLTFDDGPTPELTPWILDMLEELNVKATFFCVGNNVKENPELYKRIIESGHGVGNHTMGHERGIRTSEAEYIRSIEDASEVIDSVLFRPPYGRVPMKFTRRIRKNYKIIMWSWLSYDFDPEVSTEAILKSAERDIKAGAILVLHDNLKVSDRLRQILPKIVEIVKKKGYKFSVISA